MDKQNRTATRSSHSIEGQIKSIFEQLENSLRQIIQVKEQINDRNFAKNNTFDPISNSTSTPSKDLYDTTTSQEICEKSLKSNPQSVKNLNTDYAILSANKSILSTNYGDSLKVLSEFDERLIGEVCFQFDRRLIMHIFDNNLSANDTTCSKRYYGYSALNIDQLIDIEATNIVKDDLVRRKVKVFSYLKRHSGFIESKHPVICTRIINKYGLLKNRNRKFMETLNSLNIDAVKSAIVRMSSPDEFLDCLTIFQCLKSLAEKDNLSLFYW